MGAFYRPSEDWFGRWELNIALTILYFLHPAPRDDASTTKTHQPKQTNIKNHTLLAVCGSLFKYTYYSRNSSAKIIFSYGRAPSRAPFFRPSYRLSCSRARVLRLKCRQCVHSRRIRSHVLGSQPEMSRRLRRVQL